MHYRIHKCFDSYEIQRYSHIFLDGLADLDWHTVVICYNEDEANRVLKSLRGIK